MRYGIVSETYPPEINGVALTVQGMEQGLRERGHAIDLVRPRQQADADADQRDERQADQRRQHALPGTEIEIAQGRLPRLRGASETLADQFLAFGP